MRGSIKPLFLQLYTRRVKDAKQVLDLIKIHKLQEGDTLTGDESSEDNDLDANRVNALGECFILHCRRYLHGRGHPDHPIYNDLISLANRKAANDEPAFRARQFLSCMSSLPFLPLKEEALEVRHVLYPFLLCWYIVILLTIQIRFVRGPAHTRPANAPNDWKVSHSSNMISIGTGSDYILLIRFATRCHLSHYIFIPACITPIFPSPQAWLTCSTPLFPMTIIQ